MNLRTLSLVGYVATLGSVALLYWNHALFGHDVPAIAVQVAAVALMLWARYTFKLRSYHLAANPTEGGLVTNGPYRYVRHPIYAAILLFTLAGVIDNLHAGRRAWIGPVLLLTIVLGLATRIECEEKLVRARYPEYEAYARRTKRLVPGVF
jgi:protein-S-isoprenylcysteine O-methyltransferase Ste14